MDTAVNVGGVLVRLAGADGRTVVGLVVAGDSAVVRVGLGLWLAAVRRTDESRGLAAATATAATMRTTTPIEVAAMMRARRLGLLVVTIRTEPSPLRSVTGEIGGGTAAAPR